MNKFTCTGCGHSADIENDKGEGCPKCPSLSEWKAQLSWNLERLVKEQREFTRGLMTGRNVFSGLEGIESLRFATDICNSLSESLKGMVGDE